MYCKVDIFEQLILFLSKCLHTVFETMAPFLKTLHTNRKTHTQHAKRHKHLVKANTSLKTILTFLKNVFCAVTLHTNIK